ncbi:MAG: tetratricopeptide repeat protein [Bacteroidales bacterium]|nr:tetratricopeptide repeat protein [Bacteroidales bacterium]
MKPVFILSVLLLIPVVSFSQEERKHIREGYKAYMEEQYNEAEIAFRKAEDANNDSYIARYNTSTALYQQEKIEESGKRFSELMSETGDPAEQAKILHNVGNVFMKSRQYKEAVESYKESLRLNPEDQDTRYNLAYALEKLQEQENQQQQNDNKDQQSNEQEKNEQGEQQENQQQENQQQEQQQANNDKEQKENQQSQQQKQQLSKEEAERLLQAILQKEMDVKEKVDKKKATAKKIKTDKDW